MEDVETYYYKAFSIEQHLTFKMYRLIKKDRLSAEMKKEYEHLIKLIKEGEKNQIVHPEWNIEFNTEEGEKFLKNMAKKVEEKFKDIKTEDWDL